MADWESIYVATHIIYRVLVNFITAVGFSWFCLPFVARRGCAVLTGAAYLAMVSIMLFMPAEVSAFTAYGVSVLAGLLVMCALDKTRILQKIFLAVIFFTFRWLSLEIRSCFVFWFYKISIRLPGYGGNTRLQYMLFAVQCILGLSISAVLLFGSTWAVQRAYKYSEEDMSFREFVLMILPSMSGVLGFAMLLLYENSFRAAQPYDLAEMPDGFNFVRLCSYFISILTIVVIVVLFQNLKEKQEETRQNELLNSQIESMKRHINEVERLYGDIRGLRHDMGNHIMTVEALYASGARTAADEYVAALKAGLAAADNGIKSGNPVTDMILSEKKREAGEKGIKFLCEFHYPGNADINVFDISVILYNALDNAIKAAGGALEGGKEARVHIRSYSQNNIYMIEVENSVGGSPDPEPNGLWAHRPGRKDGHGYGLLNIRKVAQKYCGDISVECGGGVFRLNVMLVC